MGKKGKRKDFTDDDVNPKKYSVVVQYFLFELIIEIEP